MWWMGKSAEELCERDGGIMSGEEGARQSRPAAGTVVAVQHGARGPQQVK